MRGYTVPSLPHNSNKSEDEQAEKRGVLPLSARVSDGRIGAKYYLDADPMCISGPVPEQPVDKRPEAADPRNPAPSAPGAPGGPLNQRPARPDQRPDPPRPVFPGRGHGGAFSVFNRVMLG